MIAHFVLMRLRRPDDVETVTTQVLSLRGRIPGLVGIIGGPTEIRTANSWEVGFLMLFHDQASTLDYQSHPAHVEVAGVIRPLIESMATCDPQTSADALTSLVPSRA